MIRKPRLSTAARVTIQYALFGALWILFSDRVLFLFSANPEKLVLFSTAKGWFFILITSLLLYLLIAREMRRQHILESSLSASLAEKEALLAEVHHRVKNNLQVISSILNLERDGVEGAEARALTDRTRARLRSMSLVHERLYAAPDLSRIELGSYLRALIATLQDICGTPAPRVSCETETIPAGVETAVSFGLFASEAILNALRHGMGSGGDASVQIQLRKFGAGQLLFEVRDHGPGFPGTMRPEGLGFSLMAVLAAQLSGQFETRNDGGAVVQLLFPYAGEKNAPADA